MSDEYSIAVKRSPTSRAVFLGAGDVCVGDYHVRELVEDGLEVNITLDRAEAEDLFSFLRKELGR